MTIYNYGTLSDSDFESLAADIVEYRLGVKLERFTRGPDGGIDARHAKFSDDPTVIVQAKHYFKSEVKALIRDFKTKEMPKVRKLNPKRYILVTSAALTPSHKETLKQDSEGAIKATGDIIGLDEIDSEIVENPNIEKKNFKLWMTSANVLQRILHSGMHNKSNARIEFEIEGKISKYVHTPFHAEAIKKLKENRFIIITGPPGVGKTLLASMVASQFVAEIDKAELIWIENVASGWESLNQNKPQVFLFDDFLGSTYLDVLTGNSDTDIALFAKKISSLKNHYLVFSSRTVILNRACQLSEVLERDGFSLNGLEVRVEGYSKLEKAKILYNHLFFYDIPIGHIEAVLSDEFFFEIINHNNYNPRVIEFITNLEQIPPAPSEFPEFCLSSLDNPNEIWYKSYRNQLGREAQLICQSLFQLGDFALEGDIIELYERRIKNEGIAPTVPFNESIGVLQKSFIIRSKDFWSGGIGFSFINPSLIDFLLDYFNKNIDEQRSAIQAAEKISELIKRFSMLDETKIIVLSTCEKDFLLKLELLLGLAQLEELEDLLLFLPQNVEPLKGVPIFCSALRRYFEMLSKGKKIRSSWKKIISPIFNNGFNDTSIINVFRENLHVTLKCLAEEIDFKTTAYDIKERVSVVTGLTYDSILGDEELRSIMDKTFGEYCNSEVRSNVLDEATPDVDSVNEKIEENLLVYNKIANNFGLAEGEPEDFEVEDILSEIVEMNSEVEEDWGKSVV